MPQINTSYNTKQKSLILDCFIKNEGVHLTIDDVFSYLRENSTPVSISTVYRNVQRLADEGLISKYSVDGESGACYIYNGESDKNRFHLKCTVCSKIMYASCDFTESLKAHVASHHGFRIDMSETVFYGVCGDCLRSGKKA